MVALSNHVLEMLSWKKGLKKIAWSWIETRMDAWLENLVNFIQSYIMSNLESKHVETVLYWTDIWIQIICISSLSIFIIRIWGPKLKCFWPSLFHAIIEQYCSFPLQNLNYTWIIPNISSIFLYIHMLTYRRSGEAGRWTLTRVKV